MNQPSQLLSIAISSKLLKDLRDFLLFSNRSIIKHETRPHGESRIPHISFVTNHYLPVISSIALNKFFWGVQLRIKTTRSASYWLSCVRNGVAVILLRMKTEGASIFNFILENYIRYVSAASTHQQSTSSLTNHLSSMPLLGL